MRNLPILPQIVPAAAVVGLAFLLGPNAPPPDAQRILVKSPAALSASQGEAAPNPVDLDGDGIDDSAIFADAIAADTPPLPKARPHDDENVLVLRLVHLPCPDLATQKAVADLDAPLRRISEATSWILLADDHKDAPKATGHQLRLLGNPALDAPARILVIEPGHDEAIAAAVPASTLPEACKAPPVVS